MKDLLNDIYKKKVRKFKRLKEDWFNSFHCNGCGFEKAFEKEGLAFRYKWTDENGETYECPVCSRDITVDYEPIKEKVFELRFEDIKFKKGDLCRLRVNDPFYYKDINIEVEFIRGVKGKKHFYDNESGLDYWVPNDEIKSRLLDEDNNPLFGDD